MLILLSKATAAWISSPLPCATRMKIPVESHQFGRLRLVVLSSSSTSAAAAAVDSPINVSGVTLKLAFDQHWAVAERASNTSERFTSSGSLDLVHRLRACSDAVLVGRRTVQNDDCTLTVRRGVPFIQQPVRVIVDSKLSLFTSDRDTDYKIFSDGLPLLVYYEEDQRMGGLSEDLVAIQKGPSGWLPTSHIIHDLNSKHIHHVMVEGGPATALAFLKDKTLDRAILIFAPLTFQQPYPSQINEDVLQQGGLQKLGQFTCDGDRVECWSKPGLPWPTERLQDWP